MTRHTSTSSYPGLALHSSLLGKEINLLQIKRVNSGRNNLSIESFLQQFFHEYAKISLKLGRGEWYSQNNPNKPFPVLMLPFHILSMNVLLTDC